MLTTILAGAIIAISFSAPPGPVAMETIRRGLRGGFIPALRVQFGSIVGDMTWCIAALIGLGPLVQVDVIRNALGVAGICLLVTLGAIGVWDAFKQPTLQMTADGEIRKGAFRTGMAISLANPMAVGYWLSVGGALVASGVVGGAAAQTASFIAGFLGGIILWAFIMALAVRFGQKMLNPLAFRVITFACGATMIIFGFALASQMFSASL